MRVISPRVAGLLRRAATDLDLAAAALAHACEERDAARANADAWRWSARFYAAVSLALLVAMVTRCG